MTKKPRQYRHGDIFLIEIEDIPNDAVATSNRVLAEGETTGHKHQLVGGNVTTFMNNGQSVAIEVLDLTNLVHEEHKSITIPKGIYEVRRERDYNPYDTTSRTVRD